LFLIAWPRPGDGVIFPFLGQGWTLNYEILFYYIAALTLLSARRLRIYQLTLVILLLITIGWYLPADRPVFRFYTGSIILEFIFGVWLCHLQRSLRPLHPAICLTLAAVGIAGLVASALPAFDDVLRPVKQGIPATLIAAGFVLGKPALSGSSRVGSVLEKLGD